MNYASGQECRDTVTRHFHEILEISCQIADLESASEYLSSGDDFKRSQAEYKNLNTQFAVAVRGMYREIRRSGCDFAAELTRLERDLELIRAVRDTSWLEPLRVLSDNLFVQLRQHEARRKLQKVGIAVLVLAAVLGGVAGFYPG